MGITVNGERRQADVDPRTLLVDLLRDQLGLTGTHMGCSTGSCGACTVVLDGRTVKSCCILALDADGQEVTTIEDVASGDDLHPVQQAFVERQGLQCGFCTPGMILSTLELLRENPTPTDRDVRQAIAGNLCRCTGYVFIVEAILDAAARIRGDAEASPGET